MAFYIVGSTDAEAGVGISFPNDCFLLVDAWLRNPQSASVPMILSELCNYWYLSMRLTCAFIAVPRIIAYTLSPSAVALDNRLRYTALMASALP